MGALVQCFSTEELEQLDEHQLALLRHAIEREIRNSPEIHRILREKFGPMRDRMASQGRSQPARRPRPQRTPGSGGSE